MVFGFAQGVERVSRVAAALLYILFAVGQAQPVAEELDREKRSRLRSDAKKLEWPVSRRRLVLFCRLKEKNIEACLCLAAV